MKKIVAKAIIIRDNGEILLLYRGKTHPNFPAHLDFPGGEVEENEEWDGAVSREITEETTLTVPQHSLEKVLEKSYPHVTHALYATRFRGPVPEITLSWEHSGYKWYKKEDLLGEPVPDNADKYFIDVIEYLKKVDL